MFNQFHYTSSRLNIHGRPPFLKGRLIFFKNGVKGGELSVLQQKGGSNKMVWKETKGWGRNLSSRAPREFFSLVQDLK